MKEFIQSKFENDVLEKMKLLRVVVSLVCITTSLAQDFQQNPDATWRIFYGAVPWSALRADKGDCKSTPVYIGLGWFKTGLLPGNLKVNNTEVSATSGQKLVKTSKNTMILCSNHPLLHRWIETSSKKFEDLKKECELVVGGVEGGETIYIGRSFQGGNVQVGKIVKGKQRELVLPAKNAKNEQRLSTFEALTFNCNKACN